MQNSTEVQWVSRQIPISLSGGKWLSLFCYTIFTTTLATLLPTICEMDLSRDHCFKDSASRQWVYYYRVLDENSIEEICIGELKVQIHRIQRVEYSESGVQNTDTIELEEFSKIRDKVSSILYKINDLITSSDSLEKEEPAIGHAYRKDHTIYLIDSYIRTCDQKILYKAIEIQDNKVIKFMNVAPLSLFQAMDFEEISPKSYEIINRLFNELLA